jgi:hypothetical protein
VKPVPNNWQEAFLKALRIYGNVSKAAASAKVSRKFVYTQRESDEAFAQEWAAALDQSADYMEAEAWRRAVKGTKKPVYQNGKLVGGVQEYSDTLLIFLLKGARPEKYRERRDVEMSGPNKGPIPVQAFDYAAAIAPITSGSDEDSDPPSEDPSVVNGS